MSQPTIDDMKLKFTRDESNPHRSTVMIWQAPQGALYRTIESSGTIEVSTLTPMGWTSLLTFIPRIDGVEGTVGALERWLQIQDPDAVNTA